MQRTIAAALLLTLACGGTSWAQDKQKLQGTWKATVAPMPDNPEMKLTIVMEFQGGSVIMAVTPPNGGDPQKTVGEFKLDESAKPKSLDLVKGRSVGGQGAGAELPDMKGIYKLENDTLTLCFAHGPKEARPTEFKNPENGPPTVLVFSRQKAK